MEINGKISTDRDTSNIDLQSLARLIPPWQLPSSTLQKIREDRNRKKNKKIEFIFIFIKYRLILLFTISFTLISLFFLKTKGLSKNIIFYYYSNLVNFILTNINIAYILFFLLLILALGVYFTESYIKSYKSISTKFLLSFLISLFSLLFGFFLSFPLLIVTGFIHLNFIGGYSSLNPHSSISYGASEVMSRLNQMRKPPTILQTDDIAEDVLTLLTKNQIYKFSSYYSTYLLDYIPDNLIYKPIVPNVSLLMFEDKLLFRNIDKDDVKEISPDLGKLLVMDYLKGRYVKDKPSVSVLGRQEFLQLREKQINSDIEKIDDSIIQIKNNIEMLNNRIEKSNQMIKSNEDGLLTSISSRDVEYSMCLTAGYTGYYGEFYRFYTDQYCTNRKNYWDIVMAEYQKNINDWKQELEKNQNLLSINLETEKMFEDRKVFWAGQKESTIFELGIFYPPNNITIAIDYTSNEKLPVYLSTLVHEYFHYTSYVSEERDLPRFFDEGLTDYFSKKTYKSDPLIGYPVIVAVITQIAEKIPEDILQKIYLTKDKPGLVYLLNKNYGDNFYKDYEVYFDYLPYLDIEYQIKVADDIMSRIGGSKITISGF